MSGSIRSQTCDALASHAPLLNSLTASRIVAHPEVRWSLRQERKYDFRVRRDTDKIARGLGSATS
jgi:hypothetical protein